MYMKIKFILLLFFCSLIIYSQDKESTNTFKTEVTGIGTNAASFLEIGIGARAQGIGGSYTSVANDVTALYWNPAGIAWINQNQIEVMQSNWLVGGKFIFSGIVVPLGFANSSVGFHYVSLGFDSHPVRTVDRPEGTGETYDTQDFAVGLSYAVALTDRFSFGATAKYINQRIWHEAGSAVAVDLGIFYNTELEGLRLGFCMSNFGTELQLDGRSLDTSVDPDDEVQNFDRVPAQYTTESFPLPLTFRAGISYELKTGDFGKGLLSVDLLHPSHSPESISVGVEYNFIDMFFIRSGYQNIFNKEAINGLTLGVGVDYFNTQMNMGVRFDYSWTDWGILDNAQRFSVAIIF